MMTKDNGEIANTNGSNENLPQSTHGSGIQLEQTGMVVQKPTIGRMVIYQTTEDDQNKMRPSGNTQEFLPATIVAVWSEDLVNLKVHCDGERDLWITSSSQGNRPRQWQWPTRI